jgi:cytochrome c oxidase cbb3-type subunit IV
MIEFLNLHPGTLGLLIFFIFFMAMLAWVFRPGSKKIYTAQANIPLKEGQDERE